MHRTGTWMRRAAERAASLLLLVTLTLGFLPVTSSPAPVAAHHTNIKWPFAAGATWYISQGYNTSPADGWSHYNCDPGTLLDAISHSRSCSQYYQYKYSFDLKRLDGNTTGQQVLSPVNGTIRWIDEAFGGMSINLTDGYALAYFHTILAPGLAAGQEVKQGQVLGTVAPAGQAGNGGTPHIHFTIWQTTDGGNWSRGAIPFTDDHGVDGYDFPAQSESTRNQYWQRQIVSTNEVTAADVGAPATPTLVSPATGTTYTTTGIRPTLTWNAVAGATDYQVVVNDGDITSPWVTTTSWKMPALDNGQYAWQVRARNAGGQSPLSAKWVFWVDPPATTPTPTVTATPSGTPGALGLTLNKTSTAVNGEVQATGSGFGAGETVSLYLDSTSTTAFVTVKSAANGSFSKTFAMPETTGGSHSVIARGGTSAKKASASISVTSTLTRTPYQGPVGTSIAVTVYGFGAGESVRLNFDTTGGPLLGTAKTNAKGTGTVTITMPEGENGWHDYVGVGLTSGKSAWGALYVERSVTVSPASGAAGTTVTVAAKGFPASSAVTVAWNKTPTTAGTIVCTGGSTNSKGSYSCPFTVPPGVAGSYPVTVTTSGDISTAALFSLAGPTGVAISPTSGVLYSNVTITGGGFSANEQVRLNWNGAATWVTVQADGSGGVRWPATIPPSLPSGGNTLNAKGVTSGKTGSTSFQVTTSGGDTGTSRIGPGTYRVTATIEGLVGQTTSNGHLITPFDHFVSLPACTESSCPWLEPGVSTTYVAACGDNCYVRVTNPDTNACSVAPVWDVGPWFTNDNWWDSTNDRVLNTRAGAVNQLIRGYTGVDAARNGLDVGYGLSGGIGISNVGYQVGNRAAIDIADGTWVDIGFDQDAGIGTVVVTFLWQTGEDHGAAAAACGQTTEPTLDATPATVQAGANVQIAGTGFKAGERVAIYLDSTSKTALKTVTATSAGAISGSVGIPAATKAGSHTLIARGLTSGKQVSDTIRVTTATATPTPTPSPTPSPTPTVTTSITLSEARGPAGTTVTVSGKGYGKNETVRIYLDTQKSTPIGSTKANSSGAFSTSVVIPDAVGGKHRIHAIGYTSRLRSARSFVITPTITFSRTSGAARQTITVSVKNFAAGELVEFRWAGQTAVGGSVTVDASGAGSFKVKAPWLNGSYSATITGGTSKLSGTGSYRVVQRIRLTPTSGDGVSGITVRGTGFAAAKAVSIYWNNVQPANLLCSKRTSTTYGTFTCTVTPPVGAAAGTNLIVAVSGSLSATAKFTLTTAIAGSAEERPATATATAATTPAAKDTAAPSETPSPSPTPEATAPPEPTATPEVSETPVPTAEPTDAPTPTSTPEPVPQEVAFVAAADTSVSANAPDEPQPVESVASLRMGGEEGAVTLVTFQVSGLPEGSVVSAKLILTGAGDAGGAGGRVRVMRDYLVDEAATYGSLALSELPSARSADDSAATLAWVDPGVEVAIDVTGTVEGDGTITFVLAGKPDMVIAVSSRETSAPPRLLITYLAPPS